MTLAVGGRAQAQPCCGPITPAGQRLAQALDHTGVEQLWPAGWHVNWRTGTPDRAEPGGAAAHTHCSAFVAAIAERFGIYVLRPPQHPQELLANAQMRWLSEHGAEQGWRPVPDGRQAQALANQGVFVVISFENPDPHRPGHIAIVRPSLKSAAELEADGPQETQAGEHNHLSVAMRVGFRVHPGAFVPGQPGGARYFAHTVVQWPSA